MSTEEFVTNKLIAFIGDEDTCVGFLLAGIGETNAKKLTNFLVVTEETPTTDIAKGFKQFVARDDIHLIFINQLCAERIRSTISAHRKLIPAVLEIPSNYHPYDATKDTFLNLAKRMVFDDDY